MNSRFPVLLCILAVVLSTFPKRKVMAEDHSQTPRINQLQALRFPNPPPSVINGPQSIELIADPVTLGHDLIMRVKLTNHASSVASGKLKLRTQTLSTARIYEIGDFPERAINLSPGESRTEAFALDKTLCGGATGDMGSGALLVTATVFNKTVSTRALIKPALKTELIAKDSIPVNTRDTAHLVLENLSDQPLTGITVIIRATGNKYGEKESKFEIPSLAPGERRESPFAYGFSESGPASISASIISSITGVQGVHHSVTAFNAKEPRLFASEKNAPSLMVGGKGKYALDIWNEDAVPVENLELTLIPDGNTTGTPLKMSIPRLSPNEKKTLQWELVGLSAGYSHSHIEFSVMGNRFKSYPINVVVRGTPTGFSIKASATKVPATRPSELDLTFFCKGECRIFLDTRFYPESTRPDLDLNKIQLLYYDGAVLLRNPHDLAFKKTTRRRLKIIPQGIRGKIIVLGEPVGNLPDAKSVEIQVTPE